MDSRNINKLKRFQDNPDSALAEELRSIASMFSDMNGSDVFVKELHGEKGDTGEQGEKGDKGDIGDRGIQGERGTRGERGEKGDKGERGSDGIQGERGDNGIDGEHGSIKELSPDEIRDSLELLVNDERLNKTAVKGIDEIEAKIDEIDKKASKQAPLIGGAGVNLSVGGAYAGRVRDLVIEGSGATLVINNGVKTVNILYNLEGEVIYCLLDAPEKEAVEKHHDKIIWYILLKNNFKSEKYIKNLKLYSFDAEWKKS